MSGAPTPAHLQMAWTALLLASLRSIGQAFSLMFFGFYLTKRGFLDSSICKGLAHISMQVAIPALLFSSCIGCTQNWSTEPCPSMADTLKVAWPLLFLPVVNVGVGCLLGLIVVTIAPPAQNFRRAAIAAVAFGNSTGLPIVLLVVIHTSFPPSTSLGSVNPLLFLSVYLLTYPMIQWGLGSQLMRQDPTTRSSRRSELRDSSRKSTIEIDGGLLHSDQVAENHDNLLDHEHPSPAATPVNGDVEAAPNVPPSCGRHLLNVFKGLLDATAKPPVIAALCGILVGLTPARSWFVDVHDRDNDAPIEWFFGALEKVGAAAVPLNMLILGNSIATGASPKAARPLTNALIALCKLGIMPLVGVGSAKALAYVFPISSSLQGSLNLVIMIVTCTPTANNILVMATVAGQDKEALTSCILTQYLLAPLTLTVYISWFVSLVQ